MENSWKKILKFSLPVSLIGIADLLLIATDLFWVSLFTGDTEALTAIRLSSSIIILIETVLIAVISSLLVYVSQHFGAGNKEMYLKGISGAFSFAFIAGIAISLVGFVFHPYLSQIFGINESTNSYLNNYLIVYFIGYISISLNNFLLLLPRYFQKINIIYWGLGLAIASNIVLTPLIMILFNILNLPIVSGAALGTVLANISCSMFLLRKIFIKDCLEINLGRQHISFKIDYKLLKQNGAYIGSQIFTGLTFNFSMFIYILILSYYPKEALDVYSIATYIFVFFNVFAQNFAVSLIPIVSQNIGAGKIDEIKDIVKKMVLVMSIFGGSFALIIMLLRNIISESIATDATLIPLYSVFFLYYSFPWVLNIISFIFIFVVAGSGDYKGGMYLTISNMYIIVLASLFILPKQFSDLTTGVFITLSLINVITFLNTIVYYKLGFWKKASLISVKDENVTEIIEV